MANGIKYYVITEENLMKLAKLKAAACSSLDGNIYLYQLLSRFLSGATMVYVTSWDEFVERSVQLYKADPQSTRYCMKYRHCDGKLVLKVTDNKEGSCQMQRFSFIISSDVQLFFKSVISLLLAVCLGLLIWEECLKFKTDQAQDAKKMEKLNNIFFALMARGPDVDLSEVTGKEQMEAQPAKKGRGRKQ
ncbi:hypothetical protein WN943_016856 [Citrus x changshan-huyou]